MNKGIDYYSVLGVEKTADIAEIKTAYRTLAMRYHPDRNHGSEKAGELFKRINEAYEVLSDNEKRQEYDRLSAAKPYEAFEDFSFSSNSVNSPDNADTYFWTSEETEKNTTQESLDAHTELSITVSDIFRSEEKIFSFSYNIGRKKHQQEIKIKIHPGLHDGSIVRLSGQGFSSGGKTGDLYIKIRIVPDEIFKINNGILEVRVNVLPWDAALGGQITVPLPEGSIKAVLPPKSPSGRKLLIPGKGLPLKDGRGDVCAVINIAMPDYLSKEQIALLRKLREISS